MPDLNLCYQWAINTCNRSDVGYHQSYRNEQTVDGITYYDCSSFDWYCLKAGGFDVVGAYEKALWGYSGNAVTTHYLKPWLQELGFKQVSITGEWKPMDIVWREGHTEIVHTGGIGKGITMGARGRNGIDLPDQVMIRTSESKSGDWTRIFRYTGAGVVTIPKWIKGNRYLSESEMKNNSLIVYSYLTKCGWSFNSICALLGNMESESTINPAIWQSLNYGNNSGGYGLVQWTPATNYTSWAKSNGYSITDGNYQLKWIDERTVPTGQWIKTDAYNISFDEFKTSSESVEYLASAFLKNFERAGVEVESQRRSQAIKWKNYLAEIIPNLDINTDYLPSTPHGSLISNKKRNGYNFILFKR